MASITHWTRLNPKTRSADLRDALQARIHDPLWLLARQWQLGEFQGEDGGTPVVARAHLERAPLTRYHPQPLQDGAAAAGRPYDARKQPLETLVEREPIRPTPEQPPNWRLAAQAGLQFLRLLGANGAAKYRNAYVERYAIAPPSPAQTPLLDPESRRFLLVTAQRVPDGVRLYADLRAALRTPRGKLPAEPAIAAADASGVMKAARDWLAWYDALFSEPQADDSAWIPERMEYGFAVAARGKQGETVLTAPEYQEGHLDWYSFNVRPGASLGAGDDPQAADVVRTVMPMAVRYPGMPADRWWEFEDAKVFLGGIDVSPEDLSQLSFMEFALTYGSDWFVIPVELDIGAVYRMRSLVITDTFGERIAIRPYHQIDAANGSWRMFCPCADWRGKTGGAEPPESLLLLPPVLAASLHSAPLEDVLFLRDEMANMAWAVERIVESPLGAALNRHEANQRKRQAEPRAATPAPSQENIAAYRLATDVPENWMPLVPVKVDPNRADIRLQRGRLLRSRSGDAVAPAPLGRVLEPGRALSLFEEEVPRAGARVTRAYQYSRWIDGSTHLWVGRRKQPGRGEGWSGLRFDVVEDG